MVRCLRRFWSAELAPVFTDLAPEPTLVAILSATLLINKRYLADRTFGGEPGARWLALASWLVATALFLGLLRRTRSPATIVVGALAALGAMALGLSLAPEAGRRWHLDVPWRTPVLLMLALVWIPVAPALAAAGRDGRGGRAGGWLLAAGLALAALVLSGVGPLRLMLVDERYDKLNWCGLTFGWLFVVAAGTTWSRLGTRDYDGLGLGRPRFWLPWVLGLWAVMAVLIIGIAGRQPAFVQYYPMFREDWLFYDPRRDGWGFLAAYELGFGLYFFAWEWFFRGWLLGRLAASYGAGAIALQTVPFVLMHIGKPGPELHSSVIAGLVLGWLAWRGRSVWPCFLVHWGAALTMDLTALYHSLPPATK